MVGAFTGPPSIDAELTVGDKNQEANVQVGDDQQATVINNVQEMDKFLLLLCVVGWLLPSPGEIWRGFTALIPWRRSNGR